MQKKRYFYELDILRGIACLLVYFHHLPIYRIFGLNFAYTGACGVYLFYVISGFIISVGYDYQIKYADDLNFKNLVSNFEQNKLKIYQFWQRRFIRLFPTLLCLAIILLILLVRDSIRNHDVKLLFLLLLFIKYWAEFCFLSNEIHSNEWASKAFISVSSTWSLFGEILCYIFFPILISFRKFPIYLAYFILFSLSIKLIFSSPQASYFDILGHLDEFSIGVLIGFFYKKISINKSLLKILVTVSLINLVWFKNPQSFIQYLSIILSSTILVYSSALQIGILNWCGFGRFLNYVGRRSYFVYLMHHSVNYIMYGKSKIIYKYLAQYFLNISNLLTKGEYEILDNYYHLILLFVVLFFAEIFYRCVEIPFNRKYKP